jgi:hypothetical protein
MRMTTTTAPSTPVLGALVPSLVPSVASTALLEHPFEAGGEEKDKDALAVNMDPPSQHPTVMPLSSGPPTVNEQVGPPTEAPHSVAFQEYPTNQPTRKEVRDWAEGLSGDGDGGSSGGGNSGGRGSDDEHSTFSLALPASAFWGACAAAIFLCCWRGSRRRGGGGGGSSSGPTSYAPVDTFEWGDEDDGATADPAGSSGESNTWAEPKSTGTLEMATAGGVDPSEASFDEDSSFNTTVVI